MSCIGKMKRGSCAPHGQRAYDRMMRYLVFLLVLLAAPLSAQQVPTSAAQMQLSFAPLVKEAAPRW